MNESFLVSVIMPAYNAEKYIQAAICSVKLQSHKLWELIVIDDGSTDSTASIVKEMQKSDDRIRYHFQKNKGLGAARNAAFKLANGEWIAFLDSDDIWLDDKLSVQIGVAIKYSCSMVFSQGYYYFNHSGEIKDYNSLKGKYRASSIYPILIEHNYVPALSVLFKKIIIDQIGPHDTKPIVRGCEDWDYWLRMSRTNADFFGMERRLFKYRVHAASMSADTRSMRIAGIYVVTKNFQPDCLPDVDRDRIKKQLFIAIPFVLKSIVKVKKIKLILNYLQLVVNLFLKSVSVLPPVLIKKLFHSR